MLTDHEFLAALDPVSPLDPQPTPTAEAIPLPPAPCTVLRGDVLEVLRDFENNRFHAVLCDPPYGLSEPLHGEDAAEVLAQWILEGEYVRTKGRKAPAKPGGEPGSATSRLTGGGFMGQKWDAFVPGPALWAEVLRVTRPGGYLLAFAGTRTAPWMGIALMLAGWEVLDTIEWWYAEGFPKGGNVRKRLPGEDPLSAEPTTPEGARWDDWSTTLKPAHEPILVCRKPLGEKSVAANLLKWATGAMNVGACRLSATGPGEDPRATRRSGTADLGYMGGLAAAGEGYRTGSDGRWPANVMLTHAEECVVCGDGPAMTDECVEGCPVRMLDEQSGVRKSGNRAAGVRKGLGFSGAAHGDGGPSIIGSSGGASRFFFSAKASPADREEGTEGLPIPEGKKGRNNHPTVKPVPLLRELARLITAQPVSGWVRGEGGFVWEDRPPGEVLVPFAGSGSEVVACALEGLRAVGVEREAEYHAIAESRGARALEFVAAGKVPKHWRRRGE